MNFKSILILSCFIIHSVFCFAQKKNDLSYKNVAFGTELQVYPVGYIITITSNIFIKEKLALRFRIGANFANRHDFSGLNDDEIAKGFGGSIGLVQYIPYWKGNFIIGANVDAWNMWTDWKDGLETANPQSGTTYNLVIQPWINTGYLFRFSEKLDAGLTLGIGKELNVITNGEKVGEGWMGSFTLTVNYLFKN